MRSRNDRPKDTSWNKVAKWYDHLVGEAGSDYHQKVIFPSSKGLLNPKAGEKIIDVACGQGVWCRELLTMGCQVTGIDSAKALIEAAKSRSGTKINYLVADATNLRMFPEQTFDAASCVLAIQNMDPLAKVIGEVSRIVKPKGRFLIILNHPSFRIPRQSGWGFDEKRNLTYRRVDTYLSEMKIPINMHPSQAQTHMTWTFHRPLQSYTKALKQAGFVICDIEELVSHRENQPGKNQQAENRARHEIPLFMAILAEKKQ
jgi:ubiquinone/menaquinone biosynthesis C-methylase UbiE